MTFDRAKILNRCRWGFLGRLDDRKSLRLRKGCVRRSCRLLASFMFCIITVLVWFSVVSAGETSNVLPHGPEIDGYVSFLKEPHLSAVDYLLTLFRRADLVIICERHHAEATQYELFYRLVSDPRFIKEVGHIFTETGTSSRQQDLDHWLGTPGLSPSEAARLLLPIYRDICSVPIWEKRNLYDFLLKLYQLNQTLPNTERVQLLLSDMPFQWTGMTAAEYQDFMRADRDRVIAEQITLRFRTIQQLDPVRKKALVIMNYRHAFNDRVVFADGEKGDNVGRYLCEAFGGRVANVLLNQAGPLTSSNDQHWDLTPLQNGMWDAAFEAVGNPSIGFDFSGSPFGRDPFDLFPYRAHHLVYQDVFTGFVFYRPFREQELHWGIPGVFDDGFDRVYLQRRKIANWSPMTEEQMKELKERFVRNDPYPELDGLTRILRKWLR